jgi:hypothetical protein
MKNILFTILLVFSATILAACSAGFAPNTTPNPTVSETPTPTPSITPSPTDIPTITPSVTSTTSLISGWESYTDPNYGFSFQYPPSDLNCCSISGPMTGETNSILTIANPSTTTPGTNAPFDGLAIYVVTNSEGLTLQQYVEQEKIAQLEVSAIISGGSFVPSGADRMITIDGQTGVEIRGYCWDGIPRIYIPLPGSNQFLVIATLEKSEGSFDQTLDLILSTIHFAK